MPGDKEPIPKFAARIKAKHPEYKDVDDTLLVNKIVEKYPEYKDMVDFGPAVAEPVKKKESLQSYMQGLHVSSTDGQTGQIRNPITQKPIKKINPFDIKTDEETERKAQGIINDIMLKDGNEQVEDPIKEIDDKLKSAKDIKEFATLNRAADIARQSIAGSGTTAKRILKETNRRDADNKTMKMVENRAKKYDEAVQPLRGISDQYGDKTFLTKNALIKKEANENPSLKKEIEAMGVDINDPLLSYPGHLPNGKVGQIISKQLNDPEVLDYLQNENPELLPTFQEVQKNLLKDHPDYAANLVANKVSRAVQKSGFNNIDPIFNFYGENHKEFANLKAKEVLTPEEKEVWDAKVANNQEDYMDAPSLMQGIGESGKDFGKGILNTFTQPFTPTSETIRKKWEKEASNVSANPEGISKFMRNTGHALGLVASIGATGNVSGIANPASAGAAATALGFFGNELEAGKQKYPDSPVKAWTSAIINTGFYSALAYDIFPAHKVKSAFDKVRPEVDEIVNKLAGGKITQDAAKNELKGLASKTIDFIGGTMTKNTRISAEMALGNAINQTFDKINMDEKTFNEYHPEGETLDVAKAAFLSNIAIAGLSKFGEIRKGNQVAQDIYYDAATNPKLYERLIDEAAVNNPEINPVELKSNLKYLSTVKQELDAKGISPENQNRYLFESLRNRTLKGAEEKTKDETISKQEKEEVKHSEEIMQGILEGKDHDEIVTTKDEKEAKETLKAESDRNKMEEKGHKVVEKLLDETDENDKPKFTGIYRDVAKSDPIGFLEEVAQQAQGIDKEGKPLEGGPREKDMIPQYGADVINVAKEMFPAKKPPKVSVVLPGEIKQPETTTIAPKEYIPDPKSKGAAIILPKPKENEAIQEPIESIEPAKASEPPAEPPTPPEAAKPTSEGEEMRLTHADTEKIYQEAGLPERLETPRKRKEQLEQEANEQLANGYDFDKVSDEVMKGKYDWQDKDQFNFARKVADLKAQQKGLDVKSPEFDSLQNQIEKLSRASDVAGTIMGRGLQSRKNYVPVEETISDYMMREKEVNQNAPLTDNQKEQVQKEFNDISETEKAYQQKIAGLEAENARLRAEQEVKKTTTTTKKTKKTHEDFVKERKEIFASIKDKLAKSRGQASSTLVPYAKELFEIAPDVAKLVKNLVEEGVTKLADVVKEVHGQLKEVIPDVTEKDVHDIIAGEYNQKRPTRNKLAQDLFDLKTQAKLANKLEQIESGKEPASENKKVARNQEIQRLKEKLKPHEQLGAYKKRVEGQIKELEYKLKTGDFDAESAPKKQPLKLDKEAQELKDRLIKLKQDREIRLLKQEYANRSKADKVWDTTLQVLNVPRTIMASLDFSGLLRQGIFAGVSHPRTALLAQKESFKQAFSQKKFDEWFYDVQKDPRYEIMKQSGLFIADPHDPKLTAKEEAFMGNLAEKIPVAGALIKGSERAYVGVLNKLRYDLFTRFAERYEAQGRTFENSPEFYKELANYINNSTGRGNLGFLESAAPVLNALFFSPRLIASRVNLLTMPFRFGLNALGVGKKIPKEIRIMYTKDMLKFIGLGMTVLALAKLGGAEVEDDLRSTDAGKIKVGNTRWDIWGGFQPYVRLVAQIATGEKKTTTTGEIKKLDGKGAFGEDRADAGLRFFRGKLAPIPGALFNLAKGKDVIGQPATLETELKKSLTPLIYQDIQAAMKDKGISSLFTVGIPATFGVGVNTYSSKK